MPKQDQVVSIRLPAGLAEEIRTLTGVPFSKVARTTLINLRNNLRNRAAEGHNSATAQKEPTE